MSLTELTDEEKAYVHAMHQQMKWVLEILERHATQEIAFRKTMLAAFERLALIDAKVNGVVEIKCLPEGNGRCA